MRLRSSWIFYIIRSGEKNCGEGSHTSFCTVLRFCVCFLSFYLRVYNQYITAHWNRKWWQILASDTWGARMSIGNIQSFPGFFVPNWTKLRTWAFLSRPNMMSTLHTAGVLGRSGQHLLEFLENFFKNQQLNQITNFYPMNLLWIRVAWMHVSFVQLYTNVLTGTIIICWWCNINHKKRVMNNYSLQWIKNLLELIWSVYCFER